MHTRGLHGGKNPPPPHYGQPCSHPWSASKHFKTQTRPPSPQYPLLASCGRSANYAWYEMQKLVICQLTDPCPNRYPKELVPTPVDPQKSSSPPLQKMAGSPRGHHLSCPMQPFNMHWCPAVNPNFYFSGNNSALGANAEKILHKKS